MAYFLPGLRVIDQWGLNDPVVSHSPVPGIRTRGHVKQASRDYLVARGVNLEFGHPMLCRCSQPRKQTQPNVFIRLGGTDECVRARYLTTNGGVDPTLLLASRALRPSLGGLPGNQHTSDGRGAAVNG